jgi:2-octaprenylphenol hydroxylase
VIAQRVDIAIVGGGHAGCALAAALGGSNLRVALIEGRPLQLTWPELGSGVGGYDFRVSALTPASRLWLETLGAWGGVTQRRTAPFRHMHVWDADGTGAISFDAGEVNETALGHIVENGLLHASLLHALERHANIQVVSPAHVTGFARSVEADDKLIRIDLSDGRRLLTRLLVGADGGESPVRQWTGIRCRSWDYQHEAVVATIQTEHSHQATAWQIFHSSGPLALLPLASDETGQHYCSIVWSTSPAHAAELLQLDDDTFAAAVSRASEERLGRVVAAGPRASLPLRARHADDYVAPGVALIGDAAHTIHPLAGQGVNLGFSDARVLAEELLRAAERGLPPAYPATLARYQRRRKGENLAMLAAMEGFKQLFARPELPVRLLRNTGLRLVDQAGPLKRLVMREAMGLG